MQQLILQYLWEGITVILLKEIYEYLIGQGFSCELKDNEIELILQVDNYNIPLILRLPNHFPYEFIEIYMYKKTTLGLIICLLSCSLWAK